MEAQLNGHRLFGQASSSDRALITLRFFCDKVSGSKCRFETDVEERIEADRVNLSLIKRATLQASSKLKMASNLGSG